MNRRDIFAITGATVAASVSSSLLACAQKGGDKDKPPAAGADKGSAAGSAAPVDPHAGHHAGDRHGALTMAVAHCQLAGDACLAHCLDLLGGGDTSIVGCAKAVRDMLAVCGMISALAASSSPHLKAAAALCAAACRDCKAECDKHAAKHAECKACAEACDKVIAEASKLA